eukprot:SAG11_NODE_25641_length_356_cov_0.603113_1_plen_66_part_10
MASTATSVRRRIPMSMAAGTTSAAAATSNGVFCIPWFYTTVLVVLTLAGKAGDAFAPSLLTSHPLA